MSEVPWTTAPEAVDDVCDALGLADGIRADARAIAEQATIGSSRSGEALGAAAVWLAADRTDRVAVQATHESTADVVGVSKTCVTETVTDTRERVFDAE